jgi:hypothetical protein
LPNYYAQIDKNGKVEGVSELAGEIQLDTLIPITFEQYMNRDILFTRYVKGSFVGLVTELVADKQVIAPDGSDIAIVTISVTDWQGAPQKDYNGNIIVEVNGQQQSVKVIKGAAEISISSEEPGEFWMRTIHMDRNAELKVVASDAF